MLSEWSARDGLAYPAWIALFPFVRPDVFCKKDDAGHVIYRPGIDEKGCPRVLGVRHWGRKAGMDCLERRGSLGEPVLVALPPGPDGAFRDAQEFSHVLGLNEPP